MRLLVDNKYTEVAEISGWELSNIADIRNNVRLDNMTEFNKQLVVPSYVHGYSLAIEYYYNWFRSKFPNDFFRGGIYIDSKNVLDEYKQPCKTLVKKESPKARIVPTLDSDYDREDTDVYQAPPELYLRRSRYEDSFFKDYDRNIFLSMRGRGLRMNFTSRVRVNSRAQQLDTMARMELYFRIGASHLDYISADFHVPKSIILDIASVTGFDIKDGEIVDVVSFINYFNNHSDIPLFFKARAINQKPEFFIRVHDIAVQILSKDKLQRDDGETDGKLQFNYNIDMENVLTTTIPHFFVLHSEKVIRHDPYYDNYVQEGASAVAVYSINPYEPPTTDENGWNQAAITFYSLDPNEFDMDLSSIFEGENPMARTIKHDLNIGLSPAHFINLKVFAGEDIAKQVPYTMDWNTKVLSIDPKYDSDPSFERVYQIAVYYDRNYIYNLESTIEGFDNSRLSKYKHDPQVN